MRGQELRGSVRLKSSVPKSIPYRPEIDGLRAIAVIAVILFHLGCPGFKGGFLGVDVFFVISGFLMTAILTREMSEGRFGWLDFWSRRIRRLMPAFLTMVIALLAVAPWWIFQGDHPPMGTDLLGSLFWVSNVIFYRFSGDYWGPTAEESPLLHVWSLSIEEQFYLVLPCLIWWCVVKRRTGIAGMLSMLGIVSFAFFVYCERHHPEAAFYLLPSRMWEFLLGGLMATPLASKDRPRLWMKVDRWREIIGLLMIVPSFHLIDRLSPWIILPVLGSALLVLPSPPNKDREPYVPLLLGTLLRHPSLTTIGKWSYSLYLWHWPVIIIAKQWNLPGQYPTGWICIVITVFVGLSVLSYYLIEIPFRRHHARRPIWILGAVYAVAIVGSTVLMNSSGVYDTSSIRDGVTYGRYYSIGPNRELSQPFKKVVATVQAPESTAETNAYANSGIVVIPKERRDNTVSVVVFGDSHAGMWSRTIQTICQEQGLTASFWSIAGVKPFFTVPPTPHHDMDVLSSEQRRRYDQARIDRLLQWRPQCVVLAVHWEPENRTHEQHLHKMIEFIGQFNARVLLIERPPEGTYGNRNALQHFYFMGGRPMKEKKQYLPIKNPSSDQRSRQFVRDIAARYEYCDVVPTYDLYQQGSEFLVIDGLDGVYFDDDHLLEFGARMARDRLAEAIIKATTQ